MLYAFDATNLATELYNSNQAASNRDQFGSGNKYMTPTTANGQVLGRSHSVTLTGTNFIAGATLLFSGSGITVSKLTLVSPTEITAELSVAQSAPLGVQNASVRTTAGTSAGIPFTIYQRPIPPHRAH